jgi:hypothetical protein
MPCRSLVVSITAIAQRFGEALASSNGAYHRCDDGGEYAGCENRIDDSSAPVITALTIKYKIRIVHGATRQHDADEGNEESRDEDAPAPSHVSPREYFRSASTGLKNDFVLALVVSPERRRSTPTHTGRALLADKKLKRQAHLLRSARSLERLIRSPGRRSVI